MAVFDVSSLLERVSYIALVLAVGLIIASAIGFLVSMRRKWFFPVLHIGMTLISGVGAFFLSGLILSAVADAVIGFLQSQFLASLEIDLSDIISYNTGEITSEFLQAIARPLVFLLLFIALAFFLKTLCSIILRIVCGKKKKFRTPSAFLGALDGILVFLIIITPLYGTLSLVTDTFATFDTVVTEGTGRDVTGKSIVMDLTSDEDEADESTGNAIITGVYTELEHYSDSMFIKGLGYCGPKYLYRALTSVTVVDELEQPILKTTLSDELYCMSEGAGHAVLAYLELENDTEGKECSRDYVLDEFKLAEQSLMSSDCCAMLTSSALTKIGSNWLGGDSWMNISSPEVDSSFKPLVKAISTVLADESTETVQKDLDTILDVIGDLYKTGCFSMDTYQEVLNTIGQPGFFDGMITRMRQNNHMKPIADELELLPSRLIACMLSTNSIESGVLDTMLGNIAQSMTEALARGGTNRETLAVAIKQEFKEYGYDVSEDMSLSLADECIVRLGDDGEITVDEVKNYLIDHADEVAEEYRNSGSDLLDGLFD